MRYVFTFLFLFPALSFAGDCLDIRIFLNSLYKTELSIQGLHSFYQKNGQAKCDDGAYGEGYSDRTMRILAESQSLMELAKACQKDKAFCRFILKHIDASGDSADLEKIIKNAKDCNSSTQRELCKDVSRRAAAALKGDF